MRKYGGYVFSALAFIVGAYLRIAVSNDVELCNSGLGQFAQAFSGTTRQQCNTVNDYDRAGTILIVVSLISFVLSIVFHHRTISPVLAANSAYGKTTPVDIVSAYPANLSHCWGYNADGTPWTREQWNMYDPPRGSSSHLGQGGSGS